MAENGQGQGGDGGQGGQQQAQQGAGGDGQQQGGQGGAQTILNNGDGGQQGQQQQGQQQGAGSDKGGEKGGVWPDTWRTELAGGDEKALKRLERFQSPADIFKSYRALEQRISSGELKPQVDFPAKGTAEEQTAWRTERGIPDKPEGYLEKLPEGLVIGEEDKERVTAFAAKMHAKNAPPELVHEALAAHQELVEQEVAARATQDNAWKQETEDALRGEWGNEYRANVTRLKGYLDSMGEFGQSLMNARLPNGRPLFADPEASKYFMSIVNELEPMATLVPGAGGNQVQAAEARIGELKKMMGDQRSEYWKGPNAEKLQAEYRKLIEGVEKLKKAA